MLQEKLPKQVLFAKEKEKGKSQLDDHEHAEKQRRSRGKFLPSFQI